MRLPKTVDTCPISYTDLLSKAGNEDKSLEAGMNGQVAKPIDPNTQSQRIGR